MSALGSQNSEAGPSTLRTPPATPPSAKAKRRSWFAFTPPGVSSTKPRKSSLVDVVSVDLELEVTSSPGAGPSRTSEGTNPKEEREELTIDGRMEKESRKAKRGGVDQEGEVMRMSNLSSIRRPSNGTEERLAHDPGGVTAETNDFTPCTRKFTRTASDRETPLQPTHPKNPTQRPLSSLPPRKSSMNRNTSPTTPLNFDQKSQPPTHINLNRPLPPLPGIETTPPELPKGIVVTPSSPHRDTFPSQSSSSIHTLTAGYNGTRGSRSQSETRSRSSSKSRKATSSGRSSPIGLGLPRNLLSGSLDDITPPPVPPKPHAVSSPFPSRSTSPAPRIALTGVEGHDYDPAKSVAGQKTRVKRAKSLSAMLRTGSPVPVADVGRSAAVPDAPESMGEEEETTIKAPGVLGWLGVKRTIRRRASEGKLEASEVSEEKAPVESDDAPAPRRSSIFDKERESLGLDEELAETVRRPGRPDYRSTSSNTTVMSAPGKLSSIFNRRASSPKGINRSAEASPHSRPTDTQTIPTRNSTLTATSSQSSLVLPPIEISSPIYIPPGTWASSPTTETEEMLFSPGASANWGPGIRPWMDGSIRSSGSSALGSLPEQGVLESNMPLKLPPSHRDGRVRSWSDAPLPPSRITTSASHPQLPPTEASKSLQHSPAAETRPSLNARSNSGGNSAIIGKMKSVFGKSGNRSRGNTLLQPATIEVDEFGVTRQSAEGSLRMRTSISSSSDAPSPITLGQSVLTGTQERSILLNETPEHSPRTSYTASVSSLQTTSTRQTGRPRASTVSLAPTYNPLVPPSPNLLPSSGTPPRRRPGTMRRISNGLFGSGPSSPRNTSLFPVPARSSGSISSGVGMSDEPNSAMTSATTSPRPSAGSISAVVNGNSIKQISQRDGEETSMVWLERIVANVGRSEISNALAASSDDFHADALRMYMTRFDFTHAPLDVALRMLLMHMSLPRETQQIDRIIEAFAVRYEECEPGLFIQKDNTYVLAFSMMMLHTDAFNRHNKNKMTKADYVRNTPMEGVPPLVLEGFYDNITFTPFVFIEDDADLYPDVSAEPTPTSFGTTPAPTSIAAKTGRIDVYHMIVRNLLTGLRVDVEGQIPAVSPFSCLGSGDGSSGLDGLHRCFVMANILEISGQGGEGKRKGNHDLLGGGAKGNEKDTDMRLKVTKVGLLSRKDDAMDTSKKSSRKWKSWSVILTGSQLLFFKDPTWALTLLDQVPSASVDEGSGRLLLPRMTTFKPDEVFPVQDCVAVYDRDFTTYPHTFRFIMLPARQYLLQASDEAEMNEWISLINYASTFKTAGIRMRGSSMGKSAASLAGAAAAASHKREVRSLESVARRSESPVARKPIFGDASARSSLEGRETRKSDDLKGLVDVEGANDVVLNPGERLEEVFDEVKAELAAGRGGAIPLKNKVVKGQVSVKEVKDKDPAHTSRAAEIENKIRNFREQQQPIQTSLNGNMLLVRNLAILTPFQKVTRDRIASTLPSLTAKIRADRLQLAKLDLWISVLENDLEREKREFTRVRHVALQAAAKSLRDPLGVQGVVNQINNEGGGLVPRLALPEGMGDGGEDPSLAFGTSPAELPVIFGRQSDEFGTRPGVSRQASAVSMKSVNGNSDVGASRPRLARQISDTTQGTRVRPVLQRSSSDHLKARAEDGGGDSQGSTPPMMFTLSDVEEKEEVGKKGEQPGKRVDGEEPEDWQNTRAARRVSLANIPVDVVGRLKMSSSGSGGGGSVS